MTLKLPAIYPITDKRLSGKKSHLAILRELVRGGARLVQIRDNETATREFLSDLCKCVEFSAAKGVTLIVNDRCDLALSSGASGVHLGQDDLPAAAARGLLGRDKIIGWSTHTVGQVRKSRDLPLDYIGFGPIFTTKTKRNSAPVTGLDGLRRACRISSKPVVAIGGIAPDQIAAVLEAGAGSAAIISSIMAAKNIASQMERLLLAAMETG